MGYSLCHISERLKFAAQPTSIAIWQIAFASPPVAVSMTMETPGHFLPLSVDSLRCCWVFLQPRTRGCCARDSLGGVQKEMGPDTTLSN
jgi:hypothetical protein